MKTLIERGWADKLMLGHDGLTPLLRVGETEVPHDPTGPNGYTFLSTTAIPRCCRAACRRRRST